MPGTWYQRSTAPPRPFGLVKSKNLSLVSRQVLGGQTPHPITGVFSVSADGSFHGLQRGAGSRLKVGNCAPPSWAQDAKSRELVTGVTCTAHTPEPLCGPERQKELPSLVDKETESNKFENGQPMVVEGSGLGLPDFEFFVPHQAASAPVL